jgi:putative transposase
LTTQIREFYDQSTGIYGSPRIFFDLKEAGVACSENRVARLMRAAQIKSVRGYKRPRYKVGKPAQVAPNQLERQFQHDEPDHAWVTDITYIRTHEGWLYLAAVLDLHSRAVVGWSMGARMQTSLVLDALTMAVWRRKPKDSVIIHSDQGSQFGSDEFNRWCKDTGNHAVQCPSIKQSAFNDRILGRIGFSLSIHHMRCHGFNAATVLGALPGRP